ncbi:MAG: choice-of-anchor N protein [Deltaproteobacteria bacterium]|nr:choice-of-anchor N protein [Deltaproteobacteria bacterium]
MKKILLATIAILLLASMPVYALPVLQLDADPAIYVGGAEESTVPTSSAFTLTALLAGNRLCDGFTYLDYNFFIAAAIMPPQKDVAINFGSFAINGAAFDADDMVWGTPPAAPLEDDLAPHGVYETWYTEFAVTFTDDDVISAYDVQYGTPAPGNLYYVDFDVDVSGLDPAYGLHFDLYGYLKGDLSCKPDKTIVAPFSHDVNTKPVPEPSTMILLGLGLLGLIGGSKLRKKS